MIYLAPPLTMIHLPLYQWSNSPFTYDPSLSLPMIHFPATHDPSPHYPHLSLLCTWSFPNPPMIHLTLYPWSIFSSSHVLYIPLLMITSFFTHDLSPPLSTIHLSSTESTLSMIHILLCPLSSRTCLIGWGFVIGFGIEGLGAGSLPSGGYTGERGRDQQVSALFSSHQ